MYCKLFEYGVWKTTFNTDLKEYCYNIQSKEKGRYESNVNGWQSNELDTSSKSLKPLISHIEEQTNIFGKKYYTDKFKLDNMWININSTGSYNKLHAHPNAIFSGVYYVSSPKNSGNIFFERPDVMTIQSYTLKYNLSDYNSLNSDEWWLSNKEHTCYIFPSYMRHYVSVNKSTKDRISISFNLQ